MKYTIQELRDMPLNILRNIDINNPIDEQIVNQIVEEKTSALPPVVKFNTIVPDIKTPEQEKEWQKKIDAHNEAQKPESVKIAAAEKELEKIKEQIVAETAIPVVPESTTVTEVTKPFCDKCDSKGKVHKKDCTLKAASN